MSWKLSSKLWDSGLGFLMHWCPGCEGRHMIATKEPFPNGAKWTWDGNAEAPTFHPSINVQHGKCHYFIRAGQIQFCGDSQHRLAGQTVPLPHMPDWSNP